MQGVSFEKNALYPLGLCHHANNEGDFRRNVEFSCGALRTPVTPFYVCVLACVYLNGTDVCSYICGCKDPCMLSIYYVLPTFLQ